MTYGLKSYGKLPNASDPLVMMNEIRQRGCVHGALHKDALWRYMRLRASKTVKAVGPGASAAAWTLLQASTCKISHPCRPITCSMATQSTFVFGYRGGVVTGSDYPLRSATSLLSWEATCSLAKQSVTILDVNAHLPSVQVDHDVEIVGWGQESVTGTPFWRIRNSWGTFWGELGVHVANVTWTICCRNMLLAAEPLCMLFQASFGWSVAPMPCK